VLEATLQALQNLRAQPAGPLSQGLSHSNAQECLNQAIRPLNSSSLAAGVAAAGPLPDTIGIIVPHGVFTTPIEWTALAIAGGSRVHLKAPNRDPALVRTLSEVFQKEGLPVTWSNQRELPPVDAVVAFGSDESIDAIAKAHSNVPMARYGHRFSLALVTGDPEQAARALATDLARYDTRGCMAPTAIFCTGDGIALAEALASAMQESEHRWPRGTIDPALGPEWRRRLGLARVMGHTSAGAQWAVNVMQPAYFTPMSLPRMGTIHPIQDVHSLRQILAPWTPWLSTLGTDTEGVTIDGIHRVCPLGWMQAPPFPRDHDGRPMLSGLQPSPGEI
jgi:hypothetical protein